LGLGIQDVPSSTPYIMAGITYAVTVICRDDWSNLQSGLNPGLHFDAGGRWAKSFFAPLFATSHDSRVHRRARISFLFT
jgi:hypothetical protein